jgi:hypothetical protein
MQTVIQLRSKTMNPSTRSSRVGRQGFRETLVLRFAFSVVALLVVPTVLGGKILPAQTNGSQATMPAQKQQAGADIARSRPSAATHADAATTQRQPGPDEITVQPLASPAPIWPANQPPNPAVVRWDRRGLEIEAANSSLNQVLHQVAADTGAKLKGLAQDQRLFGSYGPGPERDVLLKLLDGSGYNVLMIGGGNTDAPLEIVLSAKSPGSPQTATNRITPPDDELNPQPEDALESPLNPTVQQQFPAGNDVKTTDPQQFMQDILARQQKIDQQQQQQNQQNNPQP